MKNKKKSVAELIVSCFYSFRQAIKIFFMKNSEFVANLDPFYAGGLLYIFSKERNLKRDLKIIIPIVLYACLQFIILPYVNAPRLIVNVLKIILCIFTMFYVMKRCSKVSIYKITVYSTIIIFLVTIASLFLNESNILWRFNDVINRYSETRLQGLFLEPSELGFHVMILLIALICFFMYAKDRRQRFLIILLILVNVITLYFARPFGAVVIGGISISVLLSMVLLRKKTKKRVAIFFVGVVGVVVAICVAIQLQNPIAMRMIDTFSGRDLSNNYRVSTSFEVMSKTLQDTNGVGFGFGNLNTPLFREKYESLGLSVVVANSFQYFIIEGGIFAIAFLIFLWWFIIKGLREKTTYLKIALLLFLFLYQIFGGHFTSGLIWAIYGLCLSDYDEKKDIFISKKKEKKNA